MSSTSFEGSQASLTCLDNSSIRTKSMENLRNDTDRE